MDDISRLQRTRNRVLVLAAGSFLLWQGATLAVEVAEATHWSAPVTVLQIALIIGAVAWTGAMVVFLLYQRAVKRAGAGAVMRDELFLRNRALAAMYGFTAMIAGAALLLGAATFVDFSATIAVRALLIVGVFVPLVAMAGLSREPDGED